MNGRHDHPHNWQLASADQRSLVDSYVCTICDARKSAAMFVFPGTRTDKAKEIAHWIEYMQVVITHQEKTIRKLREQLPTAKTSAISHTLWYLERTLVLNRQTLRQFEDSAQMLMDLHQQQPRARGPRTRRSSTTNC